MTHPYQPPPPAAAPTKKNRDVPGWIQVVFAALTFFGITGALLHIGFPDGDDHSNNTTIITEPTVTGSTAPSTAPAGTGPVTEDPPSHDPTTAPPRKPTTPPAAPDPGGKLVGTWRGSSPLSAYEQTSLSMTVVLGDDGRYTWQRDAVHDSGYWDLDGDQLAFEQDTGGRYEWPYALSGSGSRQVLSFVMEQGGTTRLHRI
jgi:hypothetical protein